MNQLQLFSVDLDAGSPPPRIVVSGRKDDRKDTLLGRCVRCGSHITESKGHCSECFSVSFCSCHVCIQIASLHRMLQNDLFRERRSPFAEIEHIRSLAQQAESVRNHPKCSGVSK